MHCRQSRSAAAHFASIDDVVVHQECVVQHFDRNSQTQQFIRVRAECPAGR
jgi:hypothetical protein